MYPFGTVYDTAFERPTHFKCVLAQQQVNHVFGNLDRVHHFLSNFIFFPQDLWMGIGNQFVSVFPSVHPNIH